MILSFHIEYRTSWGEEVRVLGSILELGNNQPGKAVPFTNSGWHSLDFRCGHSSA